MMMRAVAAVIALAPGVVLAALPQTSALSRNAGAIIGTVTDASTGRPVRQAILRARSGEFIQTRIADDRGRFYFRQLPAGTFTIEASKIGFIDGAFGKRRAGGRGIPLDLVAGEIVADADIELFRTATIGGIVVDDGNEPAIGARVIAYRRQFVADGWKYVPADWQMTDDEGRYRIHGLIPGEYVVGVPGAVVSLPVAALEEIGQTGRSTSEIGALLTMNGFIGSSEEPAALMFSKLAETSADNRNLTIRASSPTPPAADPDGRTFMYAAQYFPAADVPSRGSPVSITPGADYIGVNFQLRPVPAVRIEGTAVGPDGPAAGQMLRLLIGDSDDHGFGTEAAATLTNADGTFTFPLVPPGFYRIEARSALSVMVTPNGGRPATLTGFPLIGAADRERTMPTRGFNDLPLAIATTPLSSGALWGREQVVVSDSDVRDVLLTLAPPMAVTGRIVFEKSQGQLSAADIERVQIALEPEDGGAMPLAPVTADSSGAFTVVGVVPGQYSVRVTSAPSGWFVKTITSGGVNALDSFLIYPGATDHLAIVLSAGDTGISGTARDSRGTPLRGATVIVFPDVPRGRSLTNAANRLREVRTSRYGVFSVDALPPGDYMVAAIDEADAEGWQDPRALDRLRRLATRISVRQGERRSLDVRMAAK